MPSAPRLYCASMSSKKHLRRNDVTQWPTRFGRLERVTRHQRHHRRIGVEYKAAFARIDDVGANHFVDMALPLGRFNAQQFAFLDIAQESKMRIAMTGDDRIAPLAR